MSYRVILADPPWRYHDKLRMSDVARSAEDQYTTMTTDEICALRDGPLSVMNQNYQNDAILFCWVTNPFLLNGDGPRVCRSWGFEPKQLITWIKGRYDEADEIVYNIGMGRYTRGCTEHLILATRGQATKLIKARNLPNVILASRTRHSAKPEEQYTLIEGLVDGPYLELFARARRPGWDSVGNQLP